MSRTSQNTLTRRCWSLSVVFALAAVGGANAQHDDPHKKEIDVYSASMSAETTAYLEIEGMPAESPGDHGGEIDLLSWSWGETSRQLPPGAGTLTFRKRVDAASPKLSESWAPGKVFPRVDVRQGSLTYTLQGVTISRRTVDTAARMETIELSYAKIEVEG